MCFHVNFFINYGILFLFRNTAMSFVVGYVEPIQFGTPNETSIVMDVFLCEFFINYDILFLFRNTAMSFVVGYVEPIQFGTPAIDTVLEALRGSSKGRLVYPEPAYDSDKTCDSK